MAILKRLSYILPTALMLTGCYHEFTPEVDTKPVLCMNSLITAGEPIEVELTHTWLYSDQSADCRVSDARVSLYANDVEVASDYIPREGDRIRIVASSRAYGNAEAEVTVPYAVGAKVLESRPDHARVGCYESNGLLTADVTFDMNFALAIDDPAGADNYYLYECMGYSSFDGEWPDYTDYYEDISYFNTGIFRYEAEPIFAEHIDVLESVTGSDAYGFTFFTDRQFQGSRYTLNLMYSGATAHITAKADDLQTIPECGFEICLYSVSASYYNWANYCWQVDSGLLGEVGDVGLGDPLQAYSNVSTGAGVVAARSAAVYKIDMSDFLREALEQALNKE